MKTIYSIAFGVLLISCKPSEKLTAISNNDIPKEEENINKVITKAIPKSIKGFTFEKSVNTYFRDDVPEATVKRIIQSVKKGESLMEDKSRYAEQPEIIQKELILPYWPEFYSDKEIKGSISCSIRIDSDSYPNIIVIENGISSEVDLIFAEHISRSKFKPGIHAKSKKPVNSWVKFRQSF